MSPVVIVVVVVVTVAAWGMATVVVGSGCNTVVASEEVVDAVRSTHRTVPSLGRG